MVKKLLHGLGLEHSLWTFLLVQKWLSNVYRVNEGLWGGCHLFLQIIWLHSIQCFPVYLSFKSFSTANGFI